MADPAALNRRIMCVISKSDGQKNFCRITAACVVHWATTSPDNNALTLSLLPLCSPNFTSHFLTGKKRNGSKRILVRALERGERPSFLHPQVYVLV